MEIGVKIVWKNIDWMNGSWDTYLVSPADFQLDNEAKRTQHKQSKFDNHQDYALRNILGSTNFWTFEI